MKINIAKIAKILGQAIVAAPVIIAAAKPVLAAVKKRSAKETGSIL